MFKILFVFFCIVSNIFSETFGKDVEVEGFWRIDAAKEGYNIEIASSVCKFHFYVSSHFTFMFPPISLKVSTWKQGVK